MRSEEEVRAKLARRREWLDENEDSGAAEVGVETGWEQALEWVLSQ